MHQTSALLATLNTEFDNAENLNESAAEAFRNHPYCAVITSFPSLSEATGTRALAEIDDDRRRFTDARGRKSFAGAAAVTRASGRTISITHRHVKNDGLAAVGVVWAFAGIARPGPIKDRYSRRRTHGDLARCGAAPSPDFWVSSITAFKPAKPTTHRRTFPAPSTEPNRRLTSVGVYQCSRTWTIRPVADRPQTD